MKNFVLTLGKTPVKFELYENIVTDTWQSLLLLGKKNNLPLTYTGKFLSNETLENNVNKLSELVDTIRNDHNFHLPEWSGFINGTYSQEELNRLHEEFHRQEDTLNRSEKTSISPECKHLIEEMNVLIHTIEFIGRRPHEFQIISNFDYKSIRNPPPVPITSDMLKYYMPTEITEKNLNSVPVLMLGYATIGKDLFSCYNDNDHELIRNGLVSPQRDIRTEFIVFSGSNMSYERYDQLLLKLREWIEENNLGEYVDADSPENKLLRPVLGWLSKETSYTKEELSTLFQENEITDYYFEEVL